MPPFSPPPPLTILRPPDPVPYTEALNRQYELLAGRAAGTVPDTLLLLQHPPVITLGRNADTSGVLVGPEELRNAGIAVKRVERGGQATYHGPGQWVGYPILHLRQRGLGVRSFVTALEEVLLCTCARFGVKARRESGRPGLFTAVGKLAAIGVAVRAGVSFHGFALNVSPDLAHYRWIVPCGLTDVSPSSLQAELGNAPDMAEVAEVLVEEFRAVFERTSPR